MGYLTERSQTLNVEQVTNNLFATYAASHQDTTSASFQYFGFVNASGGWFIQRFHIVASAILYEYARGTTVTSYQANWDANGLYVGSLSFVLYPLLFSQI